MKKLFYIICLLLSVVMMAGSCDFFEREGYQDESGSQPNKAKKDSVKKEDPVANLDAFSALKEDVKKLEKNDSLREGNIGSLQSQQEELEQRVDKLEREKMGLKEMVVILVFFSIILLAVLVIIVRKLYMTRDQVRNYVHEKIPDNVSNNAGTTQITCHYQTVAQNIKSLNDSYIELKKELEQLKNARQTGQSQPVPQGLHRGNPGQTIYNRPGEFYMLPAMEDKLFDASRKSSVKNEDTYYEFILDKHNQSKAKFRFAPYDDSRLMYALKYREEILGTACEIEGNCDSGSPRFTQEEGEAELKDGKWIVLRKAVVKFL